MRLLYHLDQRPPVGTLLLFGLQWLGIAVPGLVIIGKVVATLHFAGLSEQIVYLQKLAFVMGSALTAQILCGHRLPLISGPAAVLLVGVVASSSSGMPAIYSSILIGGGLLAAASATGLFNLLQKLFTARVVAAVLLLIAFTLTPTMAELIAPAEKADQAMERIAFALVLVLTLYAAKRVLSGVWGATLVVWGLIGGSGAWLMLFPADFSGPPDRTPVVAGFFSDLTLAVAFDPGVLLSFLFCFLALAINDLGSMQSLAEMLRPSGSSRRISRGMTLTGLANVLAGFLGVIGPVNFSLSPGVVAATGCASRFTLLPAGVLLILLAFSPAAIGLLGQVPSVVIGAVLVYLLSAQVAAGLETALGPDRAFQFEHGLVLGLPLLLGTIVGILPEAVLLDLPAVLRPVLGNGFVVGVTLALLLEHGLLRNTD